MKRSGMRELIKKHTSLAGTKQSGKTATKPYQVNNALYFTFFYLFYFVGCEKWLIFALKYIDSILISSFWGGLNPKEIMYVAGFWVVASLLIVGLWLIHKSDK